MAVRACQSGTALLAVGEGGIDWGQALAEGVIQAAVVVLAALLAMWFTRLNDRRRAIEEAVLRLQIPLSNYIAWVARHQPGDSVPLDGPLVRSYDEASAIALEVAMAARGFRDAKKVREEAQRMWSGITAAYSLAVVDQQVLDDERLVKVLDPQKLQAAAFRSRKAGTLPFAMVRDARTELRGGSS